MEFGLDEGYQSLRFNSNAPNVQCQLLKLSKVQTDCHKRKQLKEVQGSTDSFLIYNLFEPDLREPTLRPYTDENNYEDYFLLRMHSPSFATGRLVGSH